MSAPTKPSARRIHYEEPLLNRSLARGAEVLRAFGSGADLMGNGEIAERTGLSRTTVSRLTQTLVESGFLEHDRGQRAYRLGAALLSLGHAMRTGSPVLRTVGPLMHRLAEKMRINAGLATPDRDEMIYLESVRYNRRVALRNVVAGQRVPIELTSLGRAYLTIADPLRRADLMAHFAARRGDEWPRIESEIGEARQSIADHGYCVATWQTDVVALSAPLLLSGSPLYVLNVSVTTTASPKEVVETLAGPLLDLRDRALSAMAEVHGVQGVIA